VHLPGKGDAVVQLTKTGFAFILDRDSGAPLFPVEERPVPASDVPGERAWPTQPFPTRPPPLTSTRITDDDIWEIDADHASACRERLAGLRNEGVFTPPTLQGTVVHPSNGGGANWSGGAFDPNAGHLFVPVNNWVHIVKLKRVWGSEGNVDNRGARPMRGYLRGLWFLLSGRGTGLRYITHPLTGRVGFQHEGRPCIRPPWGELVAVDLNEGAIRWRAPTGERDGVEGLFSFGPPLATAGGLVFHGGTADDTLRAHDAATGEVLARFALPAGLHAGPITYRARADGPQLLVIAPGGHIGVGSTLGDHVIAYRLPRPQPATTIAQGTDGGRR
jgi:quinoprotein glucose dehydrogenase